MDARLYNKRKDCRCFLGKRTRYPDYRVGNCRLGLWQHAQLYQHYRLACGIHRELAAEPMYSFAKEEEERACQRAQAQDDDDTPN